MKYGKELKNFKKPFFKGFFSFIIKKNGGVSPPFKFLD